MIEYKKNPFKGLTVYKNNHQNKTYNCHNCNKDDNRLQFLKCAKIECNTFFCKKCIKSYKDSTFSICFVCMKVCQCGSCLNFKKDDDVENTQEKRNVVKIGEFVIFEENQDFMSSSLISHSDEVSSLKSTQVHVKNSDNIHEIKQTITIDKKENFEKQSLNEFYDSLGQTHSNIYPNIVNIINNFQNFQRTQTNSTDEEILTTIRNKLFTINYSSMMQRNFINNLLNNLEMVVHNYAKLQLNGMNASDNMRQGSEGHNFMKSLFTQMEVLKNIYSTTNNMTKVLNSDYEELKLKGIHLFKSMDPSSTNLYYNNPLNSLFSPDMKIQKLFNTLLNNGSNANFTNISPHNISNNNFSFPKTFNQSKTFQQLSQDINHKS